MRLSFILPFHLEVGVLFSTIPLHFLHLALHDAGTLANGIGQCDNGCTGLGLSGSVAVLQFLQCLSRNFVGSGAGGNGLWWWASIGEEFLIVSGTFDNFILDNDEETGALFVGSDPATTVTDHVRFLFR